MEQGRLFVLFLVVHAHSGTSVFSESSVQPKNALRTWCFARLLLGAFVFLEMDLSLLVCEALSLVVTKLCNRFFQENTLDIIYGV